MAFTESGGVSIPSLSKPARPTLEGIPPEIRLKIYGYLIYDMETSACDDLEAPFTSIMGTCRTFYKEYKAEFWPKTQIYLTVPSVEIETDFWAQATFVRPSQPGFLGWWTEVDLFRGRFASLMNDISLPELKIYMLLNGELGNRIADLAQMIRSASRIEKLELHFASDPYWSTGHDKQLSLAISVVNLFEHLENVGDVIISPELSQAHLNRFPEYRQKLIEATRRVMAWGGGRVVADIPWRDEDVEGPIDIPHIHIRLKWTTRLG